MPPKPKPKPAQPAKPAKGKTIATLRHKEARRKNLPTVEYQSLMREKDQSPSKSLTSAAIATSTLSLSGAARMTRTGQTSLFLRRRCTSRKRSIPRRSLTTCSGSQRPAPPAPRRKLISSPISTDCQRTARATEFYQHDANWSNRMILGDSLQVMASLAEREGLRGKVQCIYLIRPTASSLIPISNGAQPAET